jgi:hypothetical protein
MCLHSHTRHSDASSITKKTGIYQTRFLNSSDFVKKLKRALALARFAARLGFVNHINPALAANNAAVTVSFLERF